MYLLQLPKNSCLLATYVFIVIEQCEIVCHLYVKTHLKFVHGDNIDSFLQIIKQLDCQLYLYLDLQHDVMRR